MDYRANFDIYSSHADLARSLFIQSFPDETCLDFFIQIEIENSIPGILEKLANICGKQEKVIPAGRNQFIGSYNGNSILLKMVFPGSGSPFTSIKRIVDISIVGAPEHVQRVFERLSSEFPVVSSTKVDWYFLNSEGDINNITIALTHDNKVYGEFYPFLSKPLAEYFEDYSKSDANILVLTGEPGTGKTSFIREMIRQREFASMVSYDENLMDKDEMFITFMSGEHNLLILEDADILMRDRIDGNHVMSKILNAGDGLIKTNKKIVMTANIAHEGDIDSALTRPGRCYDVVKFRELTAAEVTRAAAVAGMPDPGQACTLANLFKGFRTTSRKAGF